MASSRHDRIKHRCFMCGVVIDVQKSRSRHVLQQHNDRCARATREERETFRAKGRWPKPKPGPVTLEDVKREYSKALKEDDE